MELKIEFWNLIGKWKEKWKGKGFMGLFVDIYVCF